MSTALVAIDLQHVFADPDSEWATPRFAEIVEPITRLADAVERTVFTRFLAPEEPTGAWADYYERWPFALQPTPWPGYALVEPFEARAGETLDATTFGKWGPSLAARLDGAETVVLAGVATDCCVISTALAAADAGVHVLVAADACAGASDRSHAQALAIMNLYAPLIEVVDSETVLARHL